MLPANFRLIMPSGFRGEYISEFNQSETTIACGGHVFNGSGRNDQSL
jgi:hypothetical protein